MADENDSCIYSGNVPEKVTIRQRIQQTLTTQNAKKTLRKRLPILNWIRDYKMEYLSGDVVAGLTVALLIIPQGLAYGLVAGLTPNYGLYSAFVGGFVYCFIGTVKDINIGPTAIMSLMTYQYSVMGGANYAVFLCFMCGVIQLIAAVVNLGFLINFISHPVISGFTSAAALTIASSQVKNLFGLQLQTQGFVDTWSKIITHLSDTRWQDLLLGVSSIVILLVLKEIRSVKWKCVNKETSSGRFVNGLIFYLSVGRNALVVVIASCIAFAVDDNQPFRLTGNVTAGIPTFAMPPLSTTVGNATMSFADMVSDIGFGIFTIPFISTLDHIAVAGSFSKGQTLDATQEIFAVSMVNIVGSFFGSLPTTASLSRTAINLTSGARTPAGGIVTGMMVLLSLAFLTPYFRYIPRATLSAVIISAVLHMFDYAVVKPMWRSKKLDLLPLAVTFVFCLLLGLEWGIIIGIVVNLCMLLYGIAKPTIETSEQLLPASGKKFILVTPAHGISYPNAVNLKTSIEKAGTKLGGGVIPTIVDARYINETDYTSALGLKGTMANFESRDQTLIFLNVKASLRESVDLNHKMIFCDTIAEADTYLTEHPTNK